MQTSETLTPHNTYFVTGYRRPTYCGCDGCNRFHSGITDGDLTCANQFVIFEDIIHNLVPDGGANDMLDKYFAGSAYTAAWAMGLVDGASAPTYAAADMMASHTGWTENINYASATRPVMSFSAAAARAKATSANLVFAINATVTIAGAFVTSSTVKGGAVGILFGEGNLSVSRTLGNGDSLSIGETSTLT